MKISILDIGATSIDLLRASVGPGGLVTWGKSQCFVRLGEGTLLSGTISPDAWASAQTGIESLLAYWRARGSDHLVAVATSVVREAVNGPAFRKTLEHDYGVAVRVLSSTEEGTLAYRGVRAALPNGAERLLCVDVGGGCVNFAVGGDRQCRFTASLPLGIIRLLPAFAPGGSLSSGDARALHTLISRAAAPIAAYLADYRPQQLAFCSGAARSVRAYAMLKTTAPGRTGALDRQALARARREMIGAPLEALLERGAEPDHAAGLPIATTLISALVDQLAIDDVVVVDAGLREGVALDEYERLSATLPSRPSARGK
jgi:exopolyphosphatase/guanosine-5'-triphosphate,3'-diphosphate pyrophosphatase